MPNPRLSEKRWKISKEKEIAEKWQAENLYAKPTIKGKLFVIDTPPPYASGRWHMGGAIHYSQIDMIARYWRMAHGNTWFPLGIDRNGLPIEGRVEKDYKLKAHDTPRGKFLELCKTTLDKYENNIRDVMTLMGLSVDWSEPYRTDSPDYRTLTQSTFIELWKKGLIYEATKPNNWCPGCQTTLADAEVEHKTVHSHLVYLKFQLKEGGTIMIATSRPELLAACQAIIVHPDDEKYKEYQGKTAIIPIFNREILITPRQEAKTDFGTGAMMVCSYGDVNDVNLFRDMKLTETIVIDKAGKMNKLAGKYQGQFNLKARKNIIEDLKSEGFVEKIEEIEHDIPICWRSKDALELISLPEFYLKQMEFTEKIRELSDEIIFHPSWMKRPLIDWIDAVSQDWPISRRRFYGTPVPIFYCPDHGAWVPETGKYYESWDLVLPCPECGKDSKGDKRVLDTWMDSSVSALKVSQYDKDKEFFDKAFPVFLRPQAKDIIRTWLFYSLLRVYQITGEKAFEHVWISGHVTDTHGKKMSKSIGNVLYPETFVEKYGADAVRFQGAAETKLGADIRVNEERIRGAKKFVQKLYNVARFISMFEKPLTEDDSLLKSSDKWILSELSKVIKKSIEGYEEMDMFIPATEIRNFVWDTFAPHYIELVKTRAYDGDQGAIITLNLVLKALLKLLAPIIPFMTDAVYRELYGESVHTQKIPIVEIEEEHPTERLKAFNEKVWGAKKEKGISLKEKIELDVPLELKLYESDLIAMHHLKK